MTKQEIDNFNQLLDLTKSLLNKNQELQAQLDIKQAIIEEHLPAILKNMNINKNIEYRERRAYNKQKE